ncbi:MAG: PilZ domain-containing protein, partial [bacterium]
PEGVGRVVGPLALLTMQPPRPIKPTPGTPTQGDALVVRAHQRVRCSLLAQAEIAATHASAIVLAPNALDSAGVLPGTITDISRGGVAFRTKVYLPKHAHIIITITDPQAAAPEHRPALSLESTIARVVMADREPTYELGTSFIELTPVQAEAMTRLIAHIAATQPANAATVGEGGRRVA